MKKTISILLFFLTAVLLSAQNQAPVSMMYDGINNSSANLYGTARSVSMGNAMTAVGGDLGSIAVNPAGGAVSKYAQFAITPSLSISSVSSSFSPEGELSYGPSSTQTNTRFILPSVGVSLGMDTGNEVGARSFSFAFLLVQTREFNTGFISSGLNSNTSLLSEFGKSASGLTHSQLNSYDSDASWDLVCGYRGRLFGGLGDNEYAGNSAAFKNGIYVIPAALLQTASSTETGYKKDLLFNISTDISGVLFLGASVGIPYLYRSLQQSYYETPNGSYTDFCIKLPDKDGNMTETYFTGGRYSFGQNTRMRGIYGKVGAIYLPCRNLRIGAAIQTPVACTFTEDYSYSASSTYEASSCNASANSPVDSWTYRMTSPWSFNVGLAYTFGERGLLSADYEFMDYKSMKFSVLGTPSDYFYNLNRTIKEYCGISHSVRVGAEYRITSTLTARAGFSMITSPERIRYDKFSPGTVISAADYCSNINSFLQGLGSSKMAKDINYAYSLGFGYSSPGSFFVDAAVRLNSYPVSLYMPYYDYDHYSSDCVYHRVGTLTEQLSPRIRNNRRLFDVMLTLGWRF